MSKHTAQVTCGEHVGAFVTIRWNHDKWIKLTWTSAGVCDMTTLGIDNYGAPIYNAAQCPNTMKASQWACKVCEAGKDALGPADLLKLLLTMKN